MTSPRLTQIRAQWDRLSMRERRLLSLLGTCLVGLIVFGVGFVIRDGLREIEERNSDMRQALKDIVTHKEDFARARSEMQRLEVKIPKEAAPLPGYVEAAAKEFDINIQENSDRPPQPRGKSFVEKTVEIKLRGVNLQQLAEFMRKIETGSANVVVVSRLVVRTRFNQHEQLDVEMTVSTFERGATEKPKGPGKLGRGEKS
jgi:hypothetical protein